MKTIDEFLSSLYRLNVKLWLEDEQLCYSAPEDVLTPELSQQLQERKAEILDFFQQTQLAFGQSFQAIQPVSRLEPLPLSFAQARLWFLEQLQTGSAIYNIPTAYRVQGSLNLALLKQCFNEIVRRHETLRTNFTLVEGQPVQVISETFSLEFPIIDLVKLSLDEQEKEIQRLANQEAQKNFDLAHDLLIRVTLVKLNETEHVVLLTLHHIIADGWSMEILIKELAILYEAFSKKQPSPLPELTIQYADFAVWQRQWLQGNRLQTQLAYWKKQLQGTLSVLQLPTDYPRARVQSFRGEHQTFSLSETLTQKLKILSQRENTTLFTTLLAAFKVLLYRYTGQDDIIVGSPIANRHRKETEWLIGFFVNTLVLRSHLSGNLTFKGLLHQIRETILEAYDHQDVPFEKLVEELQPERDLSYSPLFQVKFRLENSAPDAIELPSLTLSPLQQTYSTAKLDLSLDLYHTPSGIVGAFEYNKDLFAPETIGRMIGHYCTLLESITQNPDAELWELSLLTSAEQEQILFEWNQTKTPYTQDLCFHQIFEQQVEKTPLNIALVFEEQQLTYDELNRRSNQLAHYLQKLGVKPEIKVGIYLERSIEMIVALLGIMKAGGAYVPLDPVYKSDRISLMLADAHTSVVITSQKLLTELPDYDKEIICLDRDWNQIASESEENPSRDATGHVCTTQNLAYLIYTSGSTGIPKGVLISHEGLVNLTEDKIRVCDVHRDSCVLQFFSFSFDASIPEIIMALGSGGKLCLAKVEILPGPNLLKLIREQAVTHITITPSALAILPVEELPSLKMVLVGGEAPSPELINNWSKERIFINAYGPTEVTVNASMVQCGNGHSILPTIRPSANKQLYILDPYLQPVPVGVLGELYIAGVGLARGYHNQSEKTALAFVPNPFGEGRMYKTGDLAYYLPDGRIKLCSRIDNQVKIRGFRIELGEIEALLNQHPQVQTSIVTVREDSRLIGYYVIEAESNITANELRGFLRDKLPAYMIPSALVELDTLPLTPNGKIDYRALPEPDRIRSSEIEYLAPRTPFEETLTRIFMQVLGIEQISIHDDFFDLGGHSLLATQLIAQSLQAFQVELSVIDLFEAPTVAQLAQRIEKRQILTQIQGESLENEEEREEIEF
ncbi:non-ribosomal peptide synthetase [Aphanothece hegewaldii CCALA 016]|uniref:Non-ribosomal peptide synthetase n=1 Tax=Aphanothece hegewaldii CCALA 016 TaxID=2107694 RepID=A0A2T1LUC4_9CHRO|nr:non-ribosomal peptide synthetase [Aphanothece hegewaldii]PSF35010.1 non-ribosomal peptide synthetase [Aphanothece hegewaldii CCALA 016]